MMLKLVLHTVLLLSCMFILLVEVRAQNSSFNVEFEVDGKKLEKDIDIQILVYVNGKEITLAKRDREFFIFDEVKENDIFDVRVICENHNLYFPSLHYSHLQSDWVVGVENKPFDKERVSPTLFKNIPSSKILGLYFIRFSDTVLTIIDYKRSKIHR